jgi:hypothetical protein
MTLLLYFTICTALLLMGLIVEKFILDNDPTVPLTIVHSFMWFTPGINVLASGILMYHVWRWYRGT